MLIVSKFRDFYDTISVYGIDKTCVYERTSEFIKGTVQFTGRYSDRGWPYAEQFEKSKNKIKYEYVSKKFVIGFCGKLYPVVVITKEEKKAQSSKITKYCFYNAEEVTIYLEKEKLTENTTKRYVSFNDFSVERPQSLNNFFNTDLFEPLQEEFHKNNCPVFVYGRFKQGDEIRPKDFLVTNPCLKDYKFEKVKDPQTAFQDVFMYISGVLGISAPEMVEISDKEMAIKKGHGDKYSFRKPPGKRGKKQWR
jgi:hypothetical protein